MSSRGRVALKQTNISSPASPGVKPCNNDNKVESANDQTAPIANRRPPATTSRGASGEGRGTSLGGDSAALCFAAAIFDMDGVVTNTSAAHSTVVIACSKWVAL